MMRNATLLFVAIGLAMAFGVQFRAGASPTIPVSDQA